MDARDGVACPGSWAHRTGGLKGARAWARNVCERHDLKFRTFTNRSLLSADEQQRRMSKFHGVFRQRCLQRDYDGSVWGRFPPARRYNMDEVGWAFGISARRTLTLPNERMKGSCVAIRCKKASRFATMLCCVSAGDDKVQMSMVWKGQGKIKFAHSHALKKASTQSGVAYTWQKKAWCDGEVLIWWARTVFIPHKMALHGAEWVVLIMDSAGRTHHNAEFIKMCGDSQVLVWFGEPDMTDKWQPVDAGIGKTLKDLAGGDQIGLGLWLTKKANRKAWTRSRIDAQLRRRLSLEFVGKAWGRIHTDEYTSLRLNAWLRTGCLLTADGSGDAEVRPQGMSGYTPPPVGAWDESWEA